MSKLYHRMDSDLRLARKADGTRSQYLDHATRFVAHFGRSPLDLDQDDVRAYLLHLVDDLKVSVYTQKMALAAIKFLYATTIGRPEVVASIPWPKIVDPLPVVFARSELPRLFSAVTSPVVRAGMLIAYGSGLRVAEVCSLRIQDIDSKRGVIFVREGKGARPRQTMLSPILLSELRAYWKLVRPLGPWLLQGRVPGFHISRGYLQKGFRRAVKIAGISRAVSFHSLRHSFATHMLESGVDGLVIKALLGHKSLRMTARYAQVRTDLFARLPDPLVWLRPTAA